MSKEKDRIVSYTSEELREMCRQGLSETNWEWAAAKTDEEIAAADAKDEGMAGITDEWIYEVWDKHQAQKVTAEKEKAQKDERPQA